MHHRIEEYGVTAIGIATFALEHLARGVRFAADERRDAFLVRLRTVGGLTTPTGGIGFTVTVGLAGALE